MDKKIDIKNPYVGLDGYQCFGCSPDNQHGLQMKFFMEGDELVSNWEPRGFMQGYHNVLHGGIQATLMDEIGSWLIQIQLETAGVTSEMKVKYLKPVRVNQGKIQLRAKLKEQRENMVDVHVSLYGPSGKLSAEGELTYFTYPAEVARKRMYLPDKEAFFSK
jgi:uncharacterized protein (TIGR00369 family)